MSRMHRFGRLVALLCAALLVMAACADDDTLELGDEPGADDGAGAGGDAAAPDEGGGAEPGAGQGGGDPAPSDGGGVAPGDDGGAAPGDDGGAAPGDDGTGQANDGGASGTTAPPQPSVDLHGGVGSMGAELLRPEVGQVVVEIDRSDGRDLGDRAASALAAELERSGGKAVSFAGSDTLPSRDVWTTAQLREAARAHRTSGSSPGQVSIQVLVVSGRHENDAALGVAFDASSFAVFPDKMGGGLLGGLTAAGVEEAIVIHELGHLFGLVNLTGEGAFHEDPEHPGHSSNDQSVMFWAVERDIVGQVFEGGPPTDFDDADRDEMSRIRSSG